MIDFKEYLTNFCTTVDREVPGHFYSIDIIILYAVLKEIQQTILGDICEIGVAHGKSALYLSKFKRDIDNFYLFDIFSEDDKKLAIENIKKFGAYENIEINIQDTTKLVAEDVSFKNKLRLLHIDGCHEHWAVLDDLCLFSRFMSDDGVIVIDDFNDYEYPGVNSATHEFLLSKNNHKNWKIFAIGSNKAYLCQKRIYDIYINSLINFMEKYNQKENRPFEIKMCLRQIGDMNALLCDAREVWSFEKIRTNLFNRLIG